MNSKILIVDDEAFIRTLLHRTLAELEEDHDVELLTAVDGEMAVKVIVEEHPNLVFLDVMMPKMDGFTVCDTVKHNLSLGQTKVVLLTAKGQEYDKQRGEEVGADFYVTKPFDPDYILDLACEVLGIQI